MFTQLRQLWSPGVRVGRLPIEINGNLQYRAGEIARKVIYDDTNRVTDYMSGQFLGVLEAECTFMRAWIDPQSQGGLHNFTTW